MSKYRKLTHVYYKCDYHIVFTPKYRFQILEGMVKSLVEHDLQVISSWKDVQVLEMNVQKDHIHLVCSIPPISIYFRIHGYFERKNSDKAIQNLSKSKAKTLLGKSLLVKRLFC